MTEDYMWTLPPGTRHLAAYATPDSVGTGTECGLSGDGGEFIMGDPRLVNCEACLNA